MLISDSPHARVWHNTGDAMKSRSLSIFSVTVLLATLVCLSSGCAWSIGGGKHSESETPVQPTRGQELIDLKRAHEQGAVSDEEYQNTKQRILNQ